MIEKTSTRNTGGLIQFAMYHGLIPGADHRSGSHRF
jgi:hypothetical protein